MAHSHSIKEYPGQVAGVAILGAALGAGAAILFAPKRGAELRNDIKIRSTTLKTKLQNRSERMADEAKDAADKAKTSASNAKNKTQDAAKSRGRAAKNTAKDMTDEIRRNGEP